jgi:N-acetylglucosamine-6-phosphate deacetylase
MMPAERPDRETVAGRLVLEDHVEPGRLEIEGEVIVSVQADPSAATGPYVAPGFADVHVHGWGGHDASDGTDAVAGMARALLGHGVTSFLPTAETAPLERLIAFAGAVRMFRATPLADAAEALGFNFEGPCISRLRAGAQNPAHILRPADLDRRAIEPLFPDLRVWTIAPELEGALDLIRWAADHGVAVSLGHSGATADEAAAGYRAGARTTTHLFNAMSGFDHHAPGLAAAALAAETARVELIADGLHVDRWLWPAIVRCVAPDRLVLVTDAIPPAGAGDGRWVVGGLEVEVRHGECRLVSNGHLAGSTIALDAAVRNLVTSGAPLPVAVRAATVNPLELIGVTDRGRLTAGQLADLVVLDDALGVVGVMKHGAWLDVDREHVGEAPEREPSGGRVA